MRVLWGAGGVAGAGGGGGGRWLAYGLLGAGGVGVAGGGGGGASPQPARRRAGADARWRGRPQARAGGAC